MHLGGPLTIATPSDTEIIIQRAFAAPSHLVYACYTQPPLIRRWLTGPDGWTMPVCSYDARPGGSYRFEWRGPGSEFLAVSGAIEAITVLQHIDSREQFDGGIMGPPYRSELTFTPQDQATLVVNHLTYASPAHRDMAAASGMADGMEMSFHTLDGLLAELTAANGRSIP